LWEGGFLLTARAQGVVPAHAHHAIQIVIAIDGCVAICGGDEEWRESRGIVVRPDAEHSFDWLSASLREDITNVADTRLDSIVPEFRAFTEQPDESGDIVALIRRGVHGLRPGLAPTPRLDSRVTTVLDAIRASDDLRISLDKAAEMAFLSPTRFAHLFKEQVGLPLSRYMLWRKLTRAMVAIGSDETIAAAAHAADFADAAHLTRTFYQMVGMAPSVLMRGDFIEIPSPFSALSPNAGGRQPHPTE
jgi:AraC family transcriptional regulator